MLHILLHPATSDFLDSIRALSPNVIAVGGTSLKNLTVAGTYPGIGSNGESGWSGSGGGPSQQGYESEPAFQLSVQNSGQRTIPDVAFDAAELTGVVEYDSYNANNGEKRGTVWTVGDGSSLGAPCWAGLVAIVNQGRKLAPVSLPPLTGWSQTLPALYELSPLDFHDDLGGFNKTNDADLLKPDRYDQVTGLGTPIANKLVPDLIAWNLRTS